MGVKDRLSEQEAGFISLREVLTRMTETDDSSYQEAATVLYRLLNPRFEYENASVHWLINDAPNEIRWADEQVKKQALACLEQAIKSNSPLPEQLRSDPSDSDKYGFKIPELFRFLGKYGINIKKFPEDYQSQKWKRIMALSPYLTERDIAHAFADIYRFFPLDSGGPASANEIEIERQQSVIERAIEAGELAAEKAAEEVQEDGLIKWRILPSDLAAWCKAKDRHYPLPEGAFPPAINTGSFTEWKQAMGSLPTLTAIEVAYAFADIDPSIGLSPLFEEDEMFQIGGRQEIIERAIEAGELAAKKAAKKMEAKDLRRRDKKNNFYTEWEILPSDLAAWCAEKGFPSPLPLPEGVSTPKTNGGLREAPANCEQELAQCKARVQELEAVGDQRAKPQAEIDRLSGELQNKEKEIERLTTGQQDNLAQSERNSLLKMVLGMAIAKYKYAPGANRNEATGEKKGSIHADLSKHSLNVSSDTVRKFIKEAEKQFGVPVP